MHCKSNYSESRVKLLPKHEWIWRVAKLRSIGRFWTRTLWAVQLVTSLPGVVEGKSNLKGIWRVTLVEQSDSSQLTQQGRGSPDSLNSRSYKFVSWRCCFNTDIATVTPTHGVIIRMLVFKIETFIKLSLRFSGSCVRRWLPSGFLRCLTW